MEVQAKMENNFCEFTNKAKIWFNASLKILKDIFENTEVKKFGNTDFLRDSIENDLVQLQVKTEEAQALNSLIFDYAHKDNSSTIRHASEDGKIDDVAIAYCVIHLCMHDWTLHKVSTNQTIERIVKSIDWFENNKCVYYNIIKNILWGSEMPFREGGEYSRFFLYYPPKDFDVNSITNYNAEEFKLLVEKTEGIHYPKDITKDIEKVLFMFKRNRAIFLMLYFELHGSMRLRYLRESERISTSVFSRHLQYKAQVMFNNASDDQRTRLTHSMEVSGQAKTIAKQLCCNWQLTEAISLGHDIGHVPFGHQGEEALDECLHKMWAGRFAHSLQSVKVLNELARHDTIFNEFGVTGLCISSPILEGILKHDTDNLLHDIKRASWRLQYDGWREALVRHEYDADNNLTATEPEWEDGLAIGGLESQIVYWADKNAYSGHDWDEFAKSGLIDEMAINIEQLLKRMHQLRHMAHARNGLTKNPVYEIHNETDIIRFIRFHMEMMRESVYTTESDDETEEDRITKTFKAEKKVVEEKFNGINTLDELDKSISEYPAANQKDRICSFSPFSPLARFVHEFSWIYENIIKKPENRENRWILKYFTDEEYKMLMDFFKAVHDMIYLTDSYPKLCKKNDDIVWVFCRYLTGIDNRTVVRSLQIRLIKDSRKRLIDAANTNTILSESDVLELGQKAMKEGSYTDSSKINAYTHFKKIKNLAQATKAFGSIGYLDDKSVSKKSGKKDLKKWYKENLQKNMLIRLDDDMIYTYNRLSSFVIDYYIGSERVRIMKHKAHKIIRRIFDFYMSHEDMLPSEYRQRIEFDAQKLFVKTWDESNPINWDCVDDERLKSLLIMKYLFERLQEKYEKTGKSVLYKYNNKAFTLKYMIELCVDANFMPGENDILKNLLETLYKEEEHSEIKAVYERQDKIFELCKHMAKARIIADYIASMTDRYAEKKYDEIDSSSTSWSTSFHE